MSGPKISATEMKRLHLFEEDRRRLLQDLVRQKDILRRRLADLNDLQRKMLPFCSEEEIKETVAAVGTIDKTCRDSIPIIDAALDDGTNIKMKEMLDLVKKVHENDEDRIRQAQELVSQFRENFFKKKAESRRETGGGSVAGSAAGSRREEIFSKEEVSEEIGRIQSLLENLEQRAQDLNVPDVKDKVRGLSEEVRLIAADEEMDSFSAFTEVHRLDVMKIRPLREQIEELEREADALDELLSAELARYHMLCMEAGEQPKKFPFEKSSLEAIRYECGKMLSDRAGERDIRLLMKRVRDSLQKAGYVYLGEKEEDLDFYREIYRIHDNVVLHVMFDSAGKVTMEVAMEDDKDRLPHEREVEMLVKEQVKFCDEYEKIFQLINEQGMLFQKETMFPPSPEFAQIINTSEFVCEKEQPPGYSYDMYRDRREKYLSEGNY